MQELSGEGGLARLPRPSEDNGWKLFYKLSECRRYCIKFGD